MATPEGKVKAKVSALLKRYDPLYYFMPVPSGFGESTLDYIGCYRGLFFSVETKAGAGKLTERQKQTRLWMERAGGKVFEIRDEIGLKELEAWLCANGEVKT